MSPTKRYSAGCAASPFLLAAKGARPRRAIGCARRSRCANFSSGVYGCGNGETGSEANARGSAGPLGAILRNMRRKQRVAICALALSAALAFSCAAIRLGAQDDDQGI